MEKATALVQQLLTHPSVRIKNVSSTTNKLASILTDGAANLHFISDYDMTMSKYWIHNRKSGKQERNTSSHGIPALYSKISAEFKAESDRLCDTYYPIEIDRSMTQAEKTPLMIKWWECSHEAMVNEKLTMHDLESMIKEFPVEHREGLPEVLLTCRDQAIPFLVFSAGVGDIIAQVLKGAGIMHRNMYIVSNKMEFNDDGLCIGFKDPLIHVFNKSEFQLENTPYFDTIRHRTNVILLGDSLGDLQMSQGVSHHLCLNIGFLNHDIEKLEPRYLEAFDIVIKGDSSWKPIQEIMSCL